MNQPARPVLLEEWSRAWRDAFEEDERLLRDLLGPVLVRLHHAGSTSVEGLVAKPIIDTIGEVTSLSALDACRERVETAGLIWKGEYGIPRRRYVVRHAPGWPIDRTHHHIFAAGDPEVPRHLVFRDALRASTELRNAYAALKRDLRERHPDDLYAYTDAKTEFITAAVRERLEA